MIWLVRSVLCALYPATDKLPGIADTDVTGFLRRFRRETTLLMWAGVVLGTFVFVLTPLITVGIPLPSFWLPRGALERHASRIAYHPIYLLRQAMFLVKLPGGLCWGSHAKVRERFALPPYPQDPGTWRST